MVENPDWRQLLETGRQFTAMTRAEAQQRAQDLVREGQLAQDKMQSFVDGLVRTSRQRADEFVDVVRKEVQRQLEALGVTTRRPATKAKKKTATKKKSGAKKTATKKKKSAAKKKTVKKGATKKKSAAKKSAGARKPSGST
jgi:polyhydroxyalkanoate synthesis regulator phasin